MREALSMMLIKVASVMGLYAHRAHLDDATMVALQRVSVESRAHTHGQESFRTRVLDQICDAESDPRPTEAAREAERVAEKIAKPRINAFDGAFRRVKKRDQ